MSPGSWLWQFMGEADIEGEAAESEVLPEREFAPLWWYNGFTYQNGYSDHLPIILECQR